MWRVSLVCAACGRHWGYALVDEETTPQIERNCLGCKAAAKDEAGVGPKYARSLDEERMGIRFQAWTGVWASRRIA
jgi:peptide methionine sulfoxide reductase MsrB